MAHSIIGKWGIGKWGKNLAIRVPMDVAHLVVHRRTARAQARQNAQNAADEIIAESRRHSLGDTSIRDLLNEGRRAG